MNIKKTALTLLVLGVGMFGGLAIARQERTAPADRPQQVDAAELERLSAQPSLGQAIFKLAAEKLRQEKSPATTVEMALTVKVTKVAAPCGYHACVYSGTKIVACLKEWCPPRTE
jgi:hypothetical protein